MTIETNIVLDEVNANGRIYPKDVFKKALDKYLQGNALIYADSSSAQKNDLMQTIGVIDGYQIVEGKVEIKGKFLNGGTPQMYNMMYNDGSVSVTSAGYGKINEDGVVEDFQLKGFYMFSNEEN